MFKKKHKDSYTIDVIIAFGERDQKLFHIVPKKEKLPMRVWTRLCNLFKDCKSDQSKVAHRFWVLCKFKYDIPRELERHVEDMRHYQRYHNI